PNRTVGSRARYPEDQRTMSALLLLLTAVQAAADTPPAATVEVPAAPWVAAGPVWGPPPPPRRPCLGRRVSARYRRGACGHGRGRGGWRAGGAGGLRAGPASRSRTAPRKPPTKGPSCRKVTRSASRVRRLPTGGRSDAPRRAARTTRPATPGGTLARLGPPCQR